MEERKASDRVTRGSRPGAPGEKPSISVIVPGPTLAGLHHPRVRGLVRPSGPAAVHV